MKHRKVTPKKTVDKRGIVHYLPKIELGGKDVDKSGFSIGQKVEVSCTEPGVLVLKATGTPDERFKR